MLRLRRYIGSLFNTQHLGLLMLKLITNANLFAPEAMGICNILVAAEKIIYIGPHLPVLDSVLEVEVTDLKGATLVPGFIDGHAHILVVVAKQALLVVCHLFFFLNLPNSVLPVWWAC